MSVRRCRALRPAGRTPRAPPGGSATAGVGPFGPCSTVLVQPGRTVRMRVVLLLVLRVGLLLIAEVMLRLLGLVSSGVLQRARREWRRTPSRSVSPRNACCYRRRCESEG